MNVAITLLPSYKFNRISKPYSNGRDTKFARLDHAFAAVLLHIPYQSTCRRSRKNPPVGPLSGSVASQTVVSAPSSTDRGADRPPISVRTHPGSTTFASTPESR